jgi:hypothetical protein
VGVPDILTENILPVLGLCPPGSLLLPWLAEARGASGRGLGLPVKSCGATFAVAKRIVDRSGQREPGQAPVAAVLLEERDGPATLVMLDWASELSSHSVAALRSADPKAIFGIDVRIGRRCLVMLTWDDALPQEALQETAQQLSLSQRELGWLGLRSLHEVLTGLVWRNGRERLRAPERTAAELRERLERCGIRPWHPLPEPSADLLARPLRPGRRYEPRRPGTREFPWNFLPPEAVCDAALVLEAQLARRRARWAGEPRQSS